MLLDALLPQLWAEDVIHHRKTVDHQDELITSRTLILTATVARRFEQS